MEVSAARWRALMNGTREDMEKRFRFQAANGKCKAPVCFAKQVTAIFLISFRSLVLPSIDNEQL